ncbi:MAG: hypothetical protein ABJV60_11715 [Lentilitoribacter sp.]
MKSAGPNWAHSFLKARMCACETGTCCANYIPVLRDSVTEVCSMLLHDKNQSKSDGYEIND